MGPYRGNFLKAEIKGSVDEGGQQKHQFFP